MKILWLGPNRPRLIEYVKSFNDDIFITDKPIYYDSDYVQNADFLISYGYRYIIQKAILDLFPKRAINLHISYLPWNRGADPNLWSFLEDTSKGVTIHLLDQGIDTGDILVQKEVQFKNNETLRTSYEFLTEEIESLFIDNWTKIRSLEIAAVLQSGAGSYHKTMDRKKYEILLKNGWDTSVGELIGKGLIYGGTND
ncbi:formyltransferase family protein [Desulfitobacterium sp. AusDCA]|uniref:formyltransferase family protein n=1 Tax=Desulfitobacterium sp. AusDCA TaxID=3240383 RepID=UPI003DA6FE25